MEKEFAFNIGDIVWLMHNNAAVCGNITKMSYVKTISCVDFETISTNEKYYVSVDGKKLIDSYDASKLFRTKEDLLKSL